VWSSAAKAELMSSRIFFAAGGGSTWYTASTVFPEAMWWAVGHTPQILGVMRGMSSTRRPSANFSKPRSSGICR